MPDWNLLKLKRDYSIFKKIEFERAPVAVNYCFYRPEGIKILDKPAGLCEMLKVCDEKGEAFYITANEEDCAGKKLLGLQTEDITHPDGGRFGVNIGAFQRPINNLNLRRHCPSMAPGSVHYVLFTPLEQMIFEPDLLMFVCPPAQAELILRANTYLTGEPYQSIATLVGNCANLFIYPYQTGKINYTTTGIAWGMRGRRVYPEGLMIVSVPFQKLATVIEGLNEMTWHGEGHQCDREGFIGIEAEIRERTQEESKEEYWM